MLVVPTPPEPAPVGVNKLASTDPHAGVPSTEPTEISPSAAQSLQDFCCTSSEHHSRSATAGVRLGGTNVKTTLEPWHFIGKFAAPLVRQPGIPVWVVVRQDRKSTEDGFGYCRISAAPPEGPRKSGTPIRIEVLAAWEAWVAKRAISFSPRPRVGTRSGQSSITRRAPRPSPRNQL
jgi:hypothetical protein